MDKKYQRSSQNGMAKLCDECQRFIPPICPSCNQFILGLDFAIVRCQICLQPKNQRTLLDEDFKIQKDGTKRRICPCCDRHYDKCKNCDKVYDSDQDFLSGSEDESKASSSSDTEIKSKSSKENKQKHRKRKHLPSNEELEDGELCSSDHDMESDSESDDEEPKSKRKI